MAVTTEVKTIPQPHTDTKKPEPIDRRTFLKLGGLTALAIGTGILIDKFNLEYHISEKFEQAGRLTRYLQAAEKSGNLTQIAEAQKISSVWCIASAMAYYGQVNELPLASELLHCYLKGDTPGVNLSNHPELHNYLFNRDTASAPIASIITDNFNLALKSDYGTTDSGASTTSQADRNAVETRVLSVFTYRDIAGVHRFPTDKKDLRSSLDHSTFALIPSNPNPTRTDELFSLTGNAGSWTVCLEPARVFSGMTMVDIYDFSSKSTTVQPFSLTQVETYTRKLFPDKIAVYLINSLNNRLSTYLQQGVLVKNGQGYGLPVKHLAELETAGFAKSYPINAQWELDKVKPISFKIS